MFAKLAHENRRNWSPIPEPQAAETQVRRALSLLELYGASPEKDLWHAIDEVVMRRNKKISRLEFQIEILKATKQ